MDKTIRINETCVIGLPRCDFVFSSTRTCFIAYGFNSSRFEMEILRGVLEKRDIQAIEAGGALAPAQSAFCAKICSKIIVSQFCAILLNNDKSGERDIPNANVNMEYGLMLGFNKYIIPFQRAEQKLPFNVAGLDTVKYTEADFTSKAEHAVDQAIRETQQDSFTAMPTDQVLESFLLTKSALVASSDNQGNRNMSAMGTPLGFHLLHDFSGRELMYFGNFAALRAEPAALRANLLMDILDQRCEAIDGKVSDETCTVADGERTKKLFERLQVWILVSSQTDASNVRNLVGSRNYQIEVFSMAEVNYAAEQFLSGIR